MEVQQGRGEEGRRGRGEAAVGEGPAPGQGDHNIGTPGQGDPMFQVVSKKRPISGVSAG